LVRAIRGAFLLAGQITEVPQMKRPAPLILLGLFLIALSASAVAFSVMPKGDGGGELMQQEAILAGSAELDGLVFKARLGMEGKPADRDDTLIFDEGKLLSTECREICDFPARPYFVRKAGGSLEFVSITRCPERDAEIVWRGLVKDGEIKGVASWTMKRWYWTIQRDFHFTGSLAQGVAANLAME
jgi:hypothetical protein